jgi:chitin disaccharide deacetylase
VTARLIVTADDVGMHPAMTAGALRAHRHGIVTACSLVANGDAFDDAVQQLRGAPSLAVGVHLALVDGKPLAKVPSLASDGRFLSGYAAFVPSYLSGRIKTADIERELRAQIERALATGLTISHLNGHQHLHLMPRVFEVVLQLAHEYRIGYIRIVDDKGGKAGVVRTAAIRGLSSLGRSTRASLAKPIKTNNRTIGVTEAGGLTQQRLVQLIRSVAGVTELVCHPGTDDAALAQVYRWGYAWERELSALCAGPIRETIRAAGVELIAPSDL